MAYKVGMVSLGCPKNQVDGEIMLSLLRDAGYELTPDENEADAVIINTCGFIEDAKRESIENILELAALKKDGSLKAVVVTGCMAERYRGQVRAEMPEVDAVVGLGGNAKIVEVLDKVLLKSAVELFAEKSALPLGGKRVLTTPPYTAYLKIAEGCDNRCSYCAIPQIRGRYRSREIDDILREAERLAETGVRELVLVAQDTTRYGEDLRGRAMLPELLAKLEKIEPLRWIRVLYTYPERITDELIGVIANGDKILHYLDMPIQHCDAGILARMNRPGGRERLTALIAALRRRIPDIVLRTTLIAGFPGETRAQFESLMEFVGQARFDRLGCFVYSPEEDTKAALFEDQIDGKTKKARADSLMRLQADIAAEKGRARVGSRAQVLVEGYDGYIKHFYGRSYAEAPEIDGKIFFKSKRRYAPGDFARVRITDTLDYDLLGQDIMEERGSEAAKAGRDTKGGDALEYAE